MAIVPRRSLRHLIADGLRGRVARGELSPGDQLPSEPDLARELGVSRSSLRAAIALLEEDGVLRRLHGSGTYVAHQPLLRNDLSRNFGVTSMIAAMGLEPGTVDEQCAVEEPPPEVAEALDLAEGATASAFRRVRTADGRRVVDSVDWCRADVLSPSDLTALGDGSVYSALAARGLAVQHGVATIAPNTAEGAIARRLAVPRGALLMSVFQTDSTADGTVVLVSLEHHLADAFEISVYRRGPGVDEG
jgi:GntR family transcriptional regulator